MYASRIGSIELRTNVTHLPFNRLIEHGASCWKLFMVTLETDRLTLRMLRGSDLDAYAEMCADPDVMRYIGDGQPLSREMAWRNLALMVGHWSLRGYGLWAVEERSSGVLVGRIGFWYPEGWPGFELGWMLRRASWGRGYATEAARMALRFAFTQMEQPRVISLIQPENAASIRVAQRVGERLVDRAEVMGKPALVYAISREEWETQRRRQQQRTLTHDITLRDVEERDLPVFFEHQLDAEAIRMAAFPARAYDAFMAHWAKSMTNEKAILKTVVFDGENAGNMVCWEQAGECRVGYWLGRQYWGRGIATAALSQFLGYVTARPLHARVAKSNAASIRVLQKCGFAIAGEDTFQDSDGEPGSEFIMKLEGGVPR